MAISGKQKMILAFPYTTKYQALICDGAVRSGKTSIMTVAFIDWAMREFDNTSFAICGKTVGSAIKNIIVPYMALTYHRDKYQVRFTRSDNKLVVSRGKKSNRFYIYGGKDESSYMLIQGITLGGVLFDEVALMTQSFVEEAVARCLTFPNRRYWFNCNPDSPEHWFFKEWILQPEKHKALHLHFLMTDNPVLSEETIQQASQDFSGVFYDRKVRGLWVVAEGLVYPMFSKGQHVIPERLMPHNRRTQRQIDLGIGAYEKYWISVDYGITNPTSMGLWGLHNGIYYRIREFYFDSRSNGYIKTDVDLYEDLEALAGDLPITSVIVDPSAASFIVLIRRRGRFRVREADNAVVTGRNGDPGGIPMCCTALKLGLVKFAEGCEDIIREFRLYSWDEKSPVDKPIKQYDHAMDDFRYFVKTVGVAAPKKLWGKRGR